MAAPQSVEERKVAEEYQMLNKNHTAMVMEYYEILDEKRQHEYLRTLTPQTSVGIVEGHDPGAQGMEDAQRCAGGVHGQGSHPRPRGRH